MKEYTICAGKLNYVPPQTMFIDGVELILNVEMKQNYPKLSFMFKIEEIPAKEFLETYRKIPKTFQSLPKAIIKKIEQLEVAEGI